MKKKLYSPNQVLAGTFLGGPLGATYFMNRNFKTLGNEEKAKNTILFGGIFTLILILALPFIPDSFPNSIIPLSYSMGTHHLVKFYNLDKKDIKESEIYTFQSNWNVLGISTLSLAITLLLIALFFLALEKSGYITL